MFYVKKPENYDTMVVKLVGNVFSPEAEKFEQAMQTATGKTKKNIILDCRELKLIDSSGLNVLIKFIKYLNNLEKGAIIVFGASSRISSLIKAYKLDKFLKIVEDEKEAFELASK